MPGVGEVSLGYNRCVLDCLASVEDILPGVCPVDSYPGIEEKREIHEQIIGGYFSVCSDGRSEQPDQVFVVPDDGDRGFAGALEFHPHLGAGYKHLGPTGNAVDSGCVCALPRHRVCGAAGKEKEDYDIQKLHAVPRAGTRVATAGPHPGG